MAGTIRYIRTDKNLIHKDFEDGFLFLLDSDNFLIHELNEVGAIIWNELKNSPTLEMLVDKITEEYDVSREEAERDVRKFLLTLKERELVTEVVDESIRE